MCSQALTERKLTISEFNKELNFIFLLITFSFFLLRFLSLMNSSTSESVGETLSRENVGLSSGSEDEGLLQSPMTMRHPAAD